MTQTLTAQDLANTFDAFNRHDVDAVMQAFADDCVFYTVGGSEVYGTKIEGKQAIADSYTIRRSALQHHVAYMTTMAGAIAAVMAIASVSTDETRRLQKLHEEFV